MSEAMDPTIEELIAYLTFPLIAVASKPTVIYRFLAIDLDRSIDDPS